MLHYHPSTELLIDYSAGSLSLAHALCISTHLEQCKECVRQVQKMELIGSSLFEQQDLRDVPSANQDALKTDFFARLNEQNAFVDNASVSNESTLEDTNTSGFDDGYKIPKSLRQFIPNGYDDLKWTRLSPSFKTAILSNESNGAQVALTRIKAGSHMPNHAHTGDELTLVLEGSFSDENGIYRQGDFILRNHHHKHKPVVTKDAECICLTVLDAPIEFTGFFARWLNPLVRRAHPNGA
jgi:putative transcriptional regulator